MPSPLKLTEIKSPFLEIELPGGEVKSYELWATVRKLEAEESKATGGLVSGFDAIRRAFDFPTEADAAAAPGTFTLTDHMAFALKAELVSRTQELPEAKKLLGNARV